jgi:hypothetical protein
MFRNILGKTKELFVEIFVPGIGFTDVPYDQAEEYHGSVNSSVTGYRTIKQIRALARARSVEAEAKKVPLKPTFILSKSRVFRRRVGRIIYGKEGEDIFL